MSTLLKRSGEAVIVLGLLVASVGGYEIWKSDQRLIDAVNAPVNMSMFAQYRPDAAALQAATPEERAKLTADIDKLEKLESDYVAVVRDGRTADLKKHQSQSRLLYLACGLGAAITTGMGALLRSFGSRQPTISRLRPNPNP